MKYFMQDMEDFDGRKVDNWVVKLTVWVFDAIATPRV